MDTFILAPTEVSKVAAKLERYLERWAFEAIARAELGKLVEYIAEFAKFSLSDGVLIIFREKFLLVLHAL